MRADAEIPIHHMRNRHWRRYEESRDRATRATSFACRVSDWEEPPLINSRYPEPWECDDGYTPDEDHGRYPREYKDPYRATRAMSFDRCPLTGYEPPAWLEDSERRRRKRSHGSRR